MYFKSKKSLGQVFLITESIAEKEAVHAAGKAVIEIGPGLGILTRKLCENAKKVVAVEKDRDLYGMLKNEIHSKNLVLINNDFFDISASRTGIEKADIMISNIPYNLSGKVIGWLAKNNMQAVLCLQKEFVDHMLAKPDTHDYSKLSVISALFFRVTKIMNVPKGNFRPVPKVDSVIIYMKPLKARISERLVWMIGLLMQHKKKTVRNAIIDSRKYLGMEKDEIISVANSAYMSDKKVFKLAPEEILKIAEYLDHAIAA